MYTSRLSSEKAVAALPVPIDVTSYVREPAWPNRDSVVEWECAEAADEARQRHAKLAADAAKVDEISSCLRPIVAAMRKTDRAGRRAIKAFVLEVLDAESLR